MKIQSSNKQLRVRTNLQAGEDCYRNTPAGTQCMMDCQKKPEIMADWGKTMACYAGCEVEAFVCPPGSYADQ